MQKVHKGLDLEAKCYARRYIVRMMCNAICTFMYAETRKYIYHDYYHKEYSALERIFFNVPLIL